MLQNVCLILGIHYAYTCIHYAYTCLHYAYISPRINRKCMVPLKVCHLMIFVSHRETKCFSCRNKKFLHLILLEINTFSSPVRSAFLKDKKIFFIEDNLYRSALPLCLQRTWTTIFRCAQGCSWQKLSLLYKLSSKKLIVFSCLQKTNCL